MVWPPDYVGELVRRAELEKLLCADQIMLAGAIELYRTDPVAFIADCCYVFEPRNANKGEPVRIPVVPFPRQEDFIRWLHNCFVTRTSAPVEKSRDSGATWMAACFAVWLWLFYDNVTVGFGSRKEMYVDQLGDMDSIFEKIRSVIRGLPPYLIPAGLSESNHFNYMRVLNPANGSTIKGEAGDNIGRGGRSALYIVDESAFIERPKAVSAALSANTDCRIDISSSRAGTMFQAWCDAAGPKKFVFDVKDAPWHTEAWIAAKQEEFEARGESEIFAQEFLRDPTANIEGQLIKSVWIEAAIDADKKLAEKGIRLDVTGEWTAALDVADGGRDRNALAIRHGIKLHSCKSRGDLLADGAGLWAFNEASEVGVERLMYDSIGVGAGAAASLRNKKGIKTIQGWAASGEVVNPTAKYGASNRTNADQFANAKAQAWFALRDKFLATFKAIRDGRVEDPDKLIILSSEIEELRELKVELAQVTYKYSEAGNVVINKTPEGSISPNRADSVMICYAPRKVGVSIIGTF